jgi:4'-phosphopantetheinyl transferase
MHRVQAWPGAAPVTAGAIVVIGVATAHSQRRDAARLQLRRALREVLAGLLGLAPENIQLSAVAGQAPRIVLDAKACADRGLAQDTAGRIGCSLSHEAGLSLAAINLDGPIGVDLMRVQEIPDWEMVARDYLGGQAAAALAGVAPQQRARAFAKAWTAREASLKCLGRPLGEWSPERLPCKTVQLDLPPALAGALAVAA